MDSKTILVALTSFIAGGLLVSAVATSSFGNGNAQNTMSDSSASMVTELQDKTGDAYDKKFLEEMITHHEDAVEMAQLSGSRAHHDEVKRLSDAIINAQKHEISEMKAWQDQWGY